MDDLAEFYQSVILDHSKRPRNFSVLVGANRVATGSNPLCGDQVTVYMRLEQERITGISFQGSGCAISQASASLMTIHLMGKSLHEAEAVFERVRKLVTIGDRGGDELSELAALAGVHQFPARIKCATLGWHAAIDATKGPGESWGTFGGE